MHRAGWLRSLRCLSQSPHPRSRLELARTGGISSDSIAARIEQPLTNLCLLLIPSIIPEDIFFGTVTTYYNGLGLGGG